MTTHATNQTTTQSSQQAVTYEESILTTADGLQLFAQVWHAATPKAAVALIHGIAEHSSRYRHVGEYLAGCGYNVYTFDLRGHGRSPGQRSLVRHMKEYTGDVGAFLTWVRTVAPPVPLFLLGHSMGGLIVSYYVLSQTPALPVDLQGVVLSAPAVKLNNVSPLLIAVGRVLARLLPALPMREIEFAAISRDPLVIELSAKDPLTHHGGVPAATGMAMVEAVAYVQQQRAKWRWPLLILQGSADRIIDPTGGRELLEAVPVADKTLKWYEGLYHEIFNEPEKEMVMQDLCDWLDARV